MSGKIEHLLTATAANEALVDNEAIELVEGRGIVGDRYYHSSGTFSAKLEASGDFQLTLIELEEINAFNAVTGFDYAPAKFRRNIVTSGVRLNDLVGQEFSIGAVRLQGVRLCEPCAHLAGLLGQQLMQYMVHKAGLRAHIIEGGTIDKDSVIC